MSISAIACFLLLIAVQHTYPMPLKDISWLNSWLGKHPELQKFIQSCVFAASPFLTGMGRCTFSAENFTLASAQLSDIVTHPLAFTVKFEGNYQSTVSYQNLSKVTASFVGQVTMRGNGYYGKKMNEDYYPTYTFFSLESNETNFKWLVEALEPYKKSIYYNTFLQVIPVNDAQYIQVQKIGFVDTNPSVINTVNFLHVFVVYKNTNTNQDFYVRYTIELQAADLQLRGKISFS